MTRRFVLLPGMDGTGDLFGPFVRALPSDSETSVVSYPVDQRLGYAELLEVVARAVPAAPHVLVAESFSGPLRGARAPNGQALDVDVAEQLGGVEVPHLLLQCRQVEVVREVVGFVDRVGGG